MASFKDIIESTDASILSGYQLQPTTIYDLYYIQMIWDKVSPDERELLKGELSIAQRYIHDFYSLVYNQLVKYQTRNRIDRYFVLPKRVSPKSITPEDTQILKDAMAHTFRSDMVRRNLNWNFIAEALAELVLDFNVPDYSDMIMQMDKLNHAIHNTQTSVLDKLNFALIDALEDKANLDPDDYKKNVSPELRKFRLAESKKLIKEDVSLDYDVPTDKEKQMMDFYLSTVFVKTGNEDIDNTAKYFKTILYGFLQKELCDAIFYSLSAEVKHVLDNNEIQDILERLKFNDFNPKLFRAYVAGIVHQTDSKLQQLYSKSKRFTPDDEKLKGETDDGDLSNYRSEYALRYAAALYAIKKNNSTKKEFVEMCSFLMGKDEFDWSYMYGGDAWQGICKAWIKLDAASGLEQQMIWIDHVYDIQHNTGTVFNKLRAYRKIDGKGQMNYDWISRALDFKKNLKEPKQLLKLVSPDMRRFGLYYFKETEDYSELRDKFSTSTINKENLLARIHKISPDAAELAADELNNPDAVVHEDHTETVFNGVWKAGVWIDGICENIIWNSGLWINGHWISGEWIDGKWLNGFWKFGLWRDGKWSNGIWKAGEWLDGKWMDGKWENGVWYAGVHHNGRWENGEWMYGRWINGDWIDGEWRDGIWENGLWAGGTWHDGRWSGGHWHEGIWENGVWVDGEWASGIWDEGTWWGGNWSNGRWNKGNWKNGTWRNGIWHNGVWSDGRWKYGTWEDGVWQKGIWEAGTWRDGGWIDGEWHGGDWIAGRIWDPSKNKFVESKVSPAEYFGRK